MTEKSELSGLRGIFKIEYRFLSLPLFRTDASPADPPTHVEVSLIQNEFRVVSILGPVHHANPLLHQFGSLVVAHLSNQKPILHLKQADVYAIAEMMRANLIKAVEAAVRFDL